MCYAGHAIRRPWQQRGWRGANLNAASAQRGRWQALHQLQGRQRFSFAQGPAPCLDGHRGDRSPGHNRWLQLSVRRRQAAGFCARCPVAAQLQRSAERGRRRHWPAPTSLKPSVWQQCCGHAWPRKHTCGACVTVLRPSAAARQRKRYLRLGRAFGKLRTHHRNGQHGDHATAVLSPLLSLCRHIQTRPTLLTLHRGNAAKAAIAAAAAADSTRDGTIAVRRCPRCCCPLRYVRTEMICVM
jgi:hypothetical protein